MKERKQEAIEESRLPPRESNMMMQLCLGLSEGDAERGLEGLGGAVEEESLELDGSFVEEAL